jgi:cell wall-associated NlpC family hydrolase
MGVRVLNLKQSDGISIIYDSLKLGDLLFFAYPNDDDMYDHVAVYIGNGKYVDVGRGGCSINTSAGFTDPSSTVSKDINNLPLWTSKDAYPKEMILIVRRLIQDDGSLIVYKE